MVFIGVKCSVVIYDGCGVSLVEIKKAASLNKLRK